jgi:Lrp/AsnC family leucine-responsive transcriptional regulator
MDEIDLHILAILQEKARIPNVEVAREVGMAPSAVLERIRKLEKHEIIDGYEVRLNPKRFRRSLVAFITVIPEKNADDRTLGAQLAQLPEVQEVHQISGEDGFLIKVRTADTQDLGKLLRQRIRALAGVQTTKTSIALSTIKETARIPIDIID